MKLLLKLSLSCLFLLFLTTQCTVQKRVHRKGWYVEWHGVKKSNKEKENSREGIAKTTHYTIESAEERVNVSTQNEIVLETVDSDDGSVASSQELQNSDNLIYTDYESTSPISESRNVNRQNDHNEEDFPEDREEEEESLEREKPSYVIPWIWIIPGLLLLALFLYLLIGLLPIYTVASIGFMTALVSVGGIAALALSVGIFLLIRTWLEWRKPERKEKRLEKIRKKKESPDYNPDRTNITIAVVAVALSLIIFLIVRDQ